MSEIFRKKRIQVNGNRFNTAVAREQYSNDKLVAWKGRRSEENENFVAQESIETTDEFYDRASRQLKSR